MPTAMELLINLQLDIDTLKELTYIRSTPKLWNTRLERVNLKRRLSGYVNLRLPLFGSHVMCAFVNNPYIATLLSMKTFFLKKQL